MKKSNKSLVNITEILSILGKGYYFESLDPPEEILNTLNDLLEDIDHKEFLRRLKQNSIATNRFIYLVAYQDILSVEIILNIIYDEYNEQDDGLNTISHIEHWYDETLETCEKHQQTTQHSDPLKTILTSRVIDNKASELEIALYIQDQRIAFPSFMWDKKIFETHDPFILSILISHLTIEPEYQVKQIKKWQPKPLFKYHPERYLQSRQYIKAIDKKSKIEPYSFMQFGSVDSLNMIIEEIVNEMNLKGSREPLRKNIETPTSFNAIPNAEMNQYLSYSSFVKKGKQIFDISTGLDEMFSNTDVDDIPVNLLVSPYSNYYIHFGEQKSLELKENWAIDGVYIEHLPELKLIQFIFTTVPSKPQLVNQWSRNEEPVFVISIAEDLYDINLGFAVDQTLANKKKELLDRLEKGNQEMIDEATNELREMENIDLQVQDAGKRNAALEIESFNQRYPITKRALEIAVNAMCYLTAYPDDIENEWAQNTPKDLINKTLSGHPKVKQKIISKLESLGYRKVKMCGRQLQKEFKALKTSGKKVHWRRGHWKRQPYGKGNSLRKLILLKPVLVNSKQEGSDTIPGHIYISQNMDV